MGSKMHRFVAQVVETTRVFNIHIFDFDSLRPPPPSVQSHSAVIWLNFNEKQMLHYLHVSVQLSDPWDRSIQSSLLQFY